MVQTSFYKAFEDRFRGSHDLILERLKVYLPLVEPMKNLYVDAKAVDLGCGRGEWLELLNANGFQASGVDIDEGMLEAAKAIGLPVELRDAIEFLKSLPDDSISIVTGFHLAEHLSFETLQELIKESLRVLLPAGLLILETPNPENVIVGSHTFYLDPTHNRPLSPALLSFLPEFYGFARVTVFRLNGPVIDSGHLSLLNVINGTSPDYSVIAQKNADPELLKLFDAEFFRKHGTVLEELANNYEQSNQDRQEVTTQLLVLQQQVEQEKAELNRNHQEQEQALRREQAAREQELSAQTSQVRQELEALLRAQAHREQEFGQQLLKVQHEFSVQQLALQQEAEGKLERSLADKANRESLHNKKNAESQLQKESMLRTVMQREQEFTQLKERQRQEYDLLLNAQLRREQEFSAQLLAQQQETERKLASLHAEQAARESVYGKRVAESQQQVESMLHTFVQREQEFAQQLFKIQHEAAETRREDEHRWFEQQKSLSQELAQIKVRQHQEYDTLLHSQIQREQEFAAQLLAQQQVAAGKLAGLHAEQSAREVVYGKRIAETQQKIESMLHTFVQREQEFTQFKTQASQEHDAILHARIQREQEFAQFKSQASQEHDAILHARIEREQEFSRQLIKIKEEDTQSRSEYEERLHAEHARRETLLIEQLHEQKKEYCRLEQIWTEQQKTLHQEFSSLQEKLNSEILRRHDELQTAEHVRQLQTEQFARDLAVKEAEHSQRLQALNTIAVKLHGQLQGEREALARIRTSLLWRMTTPLRALASLFVPNPGSDPSSRLFEPQYLADINRLLADNPRIANMHSELREFIVPSPNDPDPVTTVAATLDELLTLHDRAFVQCAYLTLLGRAADPDGLQYYVDRLRQGISKIQILTQLRRSAEGKKYAGNLPGLDAAIKRYQATQTPLLRWLTKLINSILHNAEASAQMRRIESQLLILNRESSRCFQQMEASLRRSHPVNAQAPQAPQAVSETLAAEPPPSDIVQAAEPEGLKHLSPRAREIYSQLKTAATVHAGRAA